nr:MAG TPA: hypothetical protein [Caudoviricetes sp.]
MYFANIMFFLNIFCLYTNFNYICIGKRYLLCAKVLCINHIKKINSI